MDILFHYALNKQIDLKINKNIKLIPDDLSLIHANPAQVCDGGLHTCVALLELIFCSLFNEFWANERIH